MSVNKVVISLYRRANVGKTTTLNLVIDKLSINYQVNDVKDESLSPIDRLVTVDINGVMVGISNGGDYGSAVKRRINALLERKCDIIVTASRTRAGTTTAIIEFYKKNNYKIDWIEKSATYSKNIDKEEYENRNKKYNESDSEIVLQAIFHYLK